MVARQHKEIGVPKYEVKQTAVSQVLADVRSDKIAIQGGTTLFLTSLCHRASYSILENSERLLSTAFFFLYTHQA